MKRESEIANREGSWWAVVCLRWLGFSPVCADPQHFLGSDAGDEPVQMDEERAENA